MKKYVNKIMKCLFVALICISLASCKKKEPEGLNANRGTEYTYDFIDYIKLDIYGPDGKAFIEMDTAEFTVKDFKGENDYIAIRKKMDSLMPQLKQGTDLSSYVEILPNTGLANGDLVMIRVKDGYKDIDTGVSMNLEPYMFEITGLPEGTLIDLFDASSVMFYGLNNSDKVYVHTKNGGSLPDEIIQNITYDIKPNSTPLIADTTILALTASMKDEFLLNEKMPYYDINVYMTKHNYKYEIIADKVLEQVVNPINYQSTSKEELQGALYSHYFEQKMTKNGNEYILDKIANVQQFLATTQTIDPYSTMVTMLLRAPDDTTVCARSQIKMVRIDNDFEVLDSSKAELVHEKYCSTNFEGMEIIVNYNEGDTLINPNETPKSE